MTADPPRPVPAKAGIVRRTAGVAAATVASPAAWLTGVAGFLARGGILVLAVPVWVLPTPVEATLFLPSAAIGASGPTPEFTRELIALGVAGAVVIVAALLVAAACDLAAFERVAVPAAWPPGEADGAAAPGGTSCDAAPRRRIAQRNAFVGLVLVEALALVPVGAALVVAADRLLQVGRVEYLTPSDLAIPFVVRVIVGAADAVALVVVSLLAADAVNAVGSRLVLRRAFHRSRPARTSSVLVDAGRSVVAWLVSWTITLAAVPPGLALSTAAWARVRAAYPDWSVRPETGTVVAALAWTAAFIAAWALAAAVAGIASAIRSVVWSSALAELRGR